MDKYDRVNLLMKKLFTCRWVDAFASFGMLPSTSINLWSAVLPSGSLLSMVWHGMFTAGVIALAFVINWRLLGRMLFSCSQYSGLFWAWCRGCGWSTSSLLMRLLFLVFLWNEIDELRAVLLTLLIVVYIIDFWFFIHSDWTQFLVEL